MKLNTKIKRCVKSFGKEPLKETLDYLIEEELKMTKTEKNYQPMESKSQIDTRKSYCDMNDLLEIKSRKPINKEKLKFQS